MAKFSVDDADDDMPASDKRKRSNTASAAAAAGGMAGGGADCSKKARNLEIKEEEVEIVGGSSRQEESVADGNGGGEDGISVRIDPDVLDCSICFEPLRPPLYQCQNGHVACSSCWSKLNNKCHICSHEANFSRNIALEKIVESIRSPCSYAKWGCCKMISYAQRCVHEQACFYAPSPCPIPGCVFRGFTGWWSGHFLVSHSGDATRFNYNQSFKVNLNPSVPFLVLLGEDDHLFLLLNKNAMPFGLAFSVVCLRTGNLKWKFSCELKAVSGGNSVNYVQLNASVTNAKEWTGLHPADAFLLVPYGFCRSSDLVLDIVIQRTRSSDVM